MKVSIITIVYNNQATITDSISSVLSQSYSDIEYIIVDGLSTDGTMDIVNSYKEKVDLIISEKDNGLYDALNKGIKSCTGDVIGLLHSDDVFYDNDVIKRVVESFKLTNSDIVYGNGVYTSRFNINRVRRVYKSTNYHKRKLFFGWVPLHTCIYVKKSVFDEYGLYDTCYTIAGDYEITLRWFLNNNLRKTSLDSFLVKMRLGGKSTSSKTQKIKSLEDLQIIRKYKLFGILTLLFKIGRKFPQYAIPYFRK